MTRNSSCRSRAENDLNLQTLLQTPLQTFTDGIHTGTQYHLQTYPTRPHTLFLGWFEKDQEQGTIVDGS